MKGPGRFLALLWGAMVMVVSGSFAAEVETQFEAANKLYAQSKFVEAAVAYEGIITNGVSSAVVYFNLGNAHFKAGHIGQAIAAYRQAEKLTPRDPDLRANLRFAQNRVVGPTIKSSAWQRGLGKLSLSEWTWLAAAGVWLTAGLLVVRQLKPSLAAGLKTWTWLSAGGTVAGLLLLGLAWSQNQPGRVAIVTANEAVVRNSPLDEAPSAFTVNDGAELRVLDHKDDWLQVTDDANRFGWVKRSSVAWASRS